LTNDDWQPPEIDTSAGRISARPPRSPREALEPENAPPPPKPSRHSRNGFVILLNFFISGLVLASIVAGAALYFGKLKFIEAGPLTESRVVVVREGSSLARIADQLETAGVISNELIFRSGVRMYSAAGSLKAGEYGFSPGVSMYEVMETLKSGKGVVHKVSVPEGLTTFQIFRRVAENAILEGEMPTELPPEGSLMPDTYPFQRGTTRAELIERMRRAQERALAEIWEKRIDGLPISTPQELVTLASIVEKETGRADERPRVASVFINRLNRGMRLQSDPTILYGLFGGEGRPADRPIYRSDIDKPTPYNTYVIDGLPPTPIANPGRAAMEAVANPSRTEDLFFVADGTGGHAFAVTLDEHNENVARWRIIEKRLREEAAKRAAASGEAQAAEQGEAAPQGDEVVVPAGEGVGAESADAPAQGQ
jgi:UPF0755 protein